jgi:hypothetical protein
MQQPRPAGSEADANAPSPAHAPGRESRRRSEYARCHSFLAAADPYLGDRHVISIDVDHCILYEIYDGYSQTASWQGGSGAIFPLLSNALRPATWTSADAAGLPLAASGQTVIAVAFNAVSRIAAFETCIPWVVPVTCQTPAVLPTPACRKISAPFRRGFADFAVVSERCVHGRVSKRRMLTRIAEGLPCCELCRPLAGASGPDDRTLTDPRSVTSEVELGRPASARAPAQVDLGSICRARRFSHIPSSCDVNRAHRAARPY